MGFLDGLLSFLGANSTPLIQVVEGSCKAIEALQQNPNLTTQQRNTLDQLGATCRAFSSEKAHLAEDPDYLRAFLEQLWKSIEGVRSLVPPAILQPLEAIVKAQLSSIGGAEMAALLRKRKRPFKPTKTTMRRRHKTTAKRQKTHHRSRK